MLDNFRFLVLMRVVKIIALFDEIRMSAVLGKDDRFADIFAICLTSAPVSQI